MSELDDDRIADALEGRVGEGGGLDSALGAVLQRAAATRRRRAAFAGAGAFASVVAVATLSLAGDAPDVVRTPSDSQPPSSPAVTDGLDGPGSVPVSEPATAGSSPSTTDATGPSTSTETSTAGVPGGEQHPSTTAGGSPAPATTSPATTSPATTTPAPSPGTTAPASTAPPSAPPATAPPATAPDEPETTEPDDETPATPPFSNRVYTSAGGSITVSWNGSSLSLGSVSPAAGYTANIEDRRGNRIRVRFEGDDDWRIEVRADSHGAVTSSISS